MSIANLEKKAAIQILTYLYKKKEATRTELRDNVDAALKSIYSSIPILKDLKLIEEQTLDEFPFSVRISLTDVGRKVAKNLIAADNIISQNLKAVAIIRHPEKTDSDNVYGGPGGI